jgi:aminopeptidase
MGVKYVDVHFESPQLERAQFLYAPEAYKLYVPFYVKVRAEQIVDRDGARLALMGNGDLSVMDDVDPKYTSGFKGAKYKANEPLTSRRMAGLQPWSILDVPTRAWANKLGISIEELWEFLFEVSGANRIDGENYPIEVSNMLHKRCELLDRLQIETLHFNGEGVNLKVGLSKKARWVGGRKKAEDGTWFEANWPSFEVFTTPDWSKTEGTARITIPTNINGPVVEGLEMTFVKGRIVKFSAKKNEKVFKALLEQHEAAPQLGEIALVGLDSPLSKYTEPHFCGMLDENKRCHMAVGDAYKMCLDIDPKAPDEEFKKVGWNDTQNAVHHDMMISDETTSLVAIGYDGKKTQLMKDGHWLPPYDCK